MMGIWLIFRPLAFLSLAILLILTVARIGYLVIWWQRVESVNALNFVLVQGLRFDLVLVGMLLILPLMIMPVLASSSFLLPAWKVILAVCVTAIIMLVLFMELATPSFAKQFDARPNILFFEYFAYPKEILATLWGAYRVPVLIGVPLVLVIGWGAWRWVRYLSEPMQPVSVLIMVPAALVLVLISALFARSTLGHRPVNPSTVAMTTDTLVNELALNSTYSVSYAAYEMRHEESGGARYADMDEQSALAIVKYEMQVPAVQFSAELGGTWHSFNATESYARPKNLVIILEESLGAEFVGSLGGLDLTPNMDALREQGLAFDRLYATGTRSVRGIEAVITGFLPTPSRSVVKLGKSQRNFFTIARYLKEAGYDTSFIYGGEAHFDNMRRFFMNNGFDSVIDQKDYENPVFVGSWGVSDEDLLEQAHKEFSKPHDKPFFSLVFSSSNHTPFEFPDGRIELFDKEKQTVNNAVKYADYAVGEFFDKARESNYWKDTIFLVVADHNSRVYGSDLIPVNRFHIPGVIIGEGIAPRHETRVASQVDLAPTLMSMLGVSGTHPMPGRDFTQLPDDVPGRAIMQFNGLQAFMEEDELVVLQLGVAPVGMHFDGKQLGPAKEPDATLLEKAIAHATWAADAYESGGYSVKHTDRITVDAAR